MLFYTAVLAGSLKPCLVIVLSSSKHYGVEPLTYILHSTDFLKIYVKSRNTVHFSAAVIARNMKTCKVIVLDAHFKNASVAGALDLHFMVH